MLGTKVSKDDASAVSIPHRNVSNKRPYLTFLIGSVVSIPHRNVSNGVEPDPKEDVEKSFHPS